MSSSLVVRASGLGKSYRIYERPADRLLELLLPSRRRGTDFWALQDVDLTAAAGESVGIIGRNGSGKSTLLQLLCGLSPPSAGELTVRGRVAGLLELGAGFNPDFTGRENVHVAATILGLSADQIAARFDTIAEFAGIGSFMDRPVYEYSSGMYARLAFAVCAHVDADILLIDEVLAVGDAGFQQKCMRYLRAFRSAGGTLLFVSHDETAVLSLCERALWLDRGRLQADGPSGEVCRRYAGALQQERAVSHADRIGRRDLRQAPLKLRPESPAFEYFDFDSDAVSATGEATIESVDFFAEDSARVTSAEPGQALELRINCKVARKIDEVVVAFIVRNSLGRAIFSDDTARIENGHDTAARPGELFSAKFIFHLPFLVTGEYSIEAFVLARATSSARLLARLIDSSFLSVHSRHIGGGLANIPVIETSLEAEFNTRVDADVL